ncbi:MAG: 4Fe-4S dicluster domain-containing protein [Fibrobacterales bacterium]
MKNSKPIYTELVECRDCYKCVRACPVKAIKIDDGKAEILDDQCLYCGECYLVCPPSAKRVRSEIAVVNEYLDTTQVILSIAPSYVSEFTQYTKKQLFDVCKSIGFVAVSETATGADVLNTIYEEELKNKKSLIISAACPSVVVLVQKYFPHLMPYLSQYVSPMEIHARLLKEKYGDDIAVVFVGPCIAKKYEAAAEDSAVDAVLGFEELQCLIEQRPLQEALSCIGRENTEMAATAQEGVYYPQEGGMLKGMPFLEGYGFQGVSYSGPKTVISVLESLQSFSENPLFVELLACDGGCLRGPLAKDRDSMVLKSLLHQNLERSNTGGKSFQPSNSTFVNCDRIPLPVVHHKYSQSTIMKTLSSIGKTTPEDELDCSGCGYDSCRSFVEAVVTEKAEREMCVSYMRKRAQRKAHALIQSIPSGIMIVDNELKIVESNKRCVDMLGGDMAEIYNTLGTVEGVSLVKKVPFYHYFQSMFNGDGGLVEKDISYNNKVYSLTLFTIESGELVGAIIEDVTEPVVQQKRIVKSAEEIIHKTSKAVQQIAFLLGENAAESEIMLRTIAQAYSPQKSEMIE